MKNIIFDKYFQNTKYNKSKKEFADAALDLANNWIKLLENKDKYWPSFVAELRRTYGIGVGTEAPLVLKTSKATDAIEWCRKKKTHLSENGNYYVVPLVFERIFERIFSDVCKCKPKVCPNSTHEHERKERQTL